MTEKQREEIQKFGVNSWFVFDLYQQYQSNPDSVTDQWKSFFSGIENGNPVPMPGTAISDAPIPKTNGPAPKLKMPQAGDGEEAVALRGVAAKIIENMNASLSLPLATSQRSIPVKVLEENRRIINQYLKKNNRGKVSFTHAIGWAIVQALKDMPVMNGAYTEVDGAPHVIRKHHIYLGLAVDLQKKDGSRSLIVPNIKKADQMHFEGFLKAYEDIIERSRSGKIEPADFQGTTVTLTNPGTIGTVSSNPRLMVGQGAIIATGAIELPAQYHAMSQSTVATLGIGKVMNITSTYDHRIIQGAESGLFLKKIHDLLLGADGFYDSIFEQLRLPLKPVKWEPDHDSAAFGSVGDIDRIEKQARALQLINLYRVRGHLISNLDPLTPESHYHPELDPATFGFTVWDFDRQFITGGLSGLRTATLKEILDILHQTYCDKIGVEYMHIQIPEEKAWLQKKMETVRNLPNFSAEMKRNILRKLIKAETFEHFIHTRFLGHKRFSLEGSETIIPVLDHLLNIASDDEVVEVVLGMAHRGRLNVLANIVGKSYRGILSQFEGQLDPNSMHGSGDVKYHLGATGNYNTRNNKTIRVSVAPNPSHLEWVNPVVEGIVRAKQTRMPERMNKYVMPVLVHGDAAFAGQGVVAETLNLSQLKGYGTRGTVHLIVNNQIGFTTTAEEARSSIYATDVAKMIQVPIFHVNGDDPEAAAWITQVAFEYRQKFEKDVVIDVFGYRRHGHNEGDEPGYTQPLMYRKIDQHASTRELYAKKLVTEGVVTAEEVEAMGKEVFQQLDDALEIAKKQAISYQPDAPLAISIDEIRSARTSEETSIPEKVLKEVVKGITTLPEGFTVHTKLKKFVDNRRKLLEQDTPIDWAFAEALAFGSLLYEGTPIRLSGEDTSRGTFSHRHLVLSDMNTGEEILPLNFVAPDRARLESVDSLLSEAAVLGFEFGYSIADPLALVLWEAQFGDFANVAQVIIDNFIAASKSKWSLSNSLVMLLPHGYEGQGPEHSSARLERFLQLCANENMIVCNLSTPAQYFHALRRQIRKKTQMPLIVMTPKSLLRLPAARSPKTAFTSGQFFEVLDDESIAAREKIRRVVLCAGKVYYDLQKTREEQKIDDVALVRVEQFHPYPGDQIKWILTAYTNAREVVWTQEEPKNMGAWTFLAPRLTEDLAEHQKLLYVGRAESASPASGSSKIHLQQQETIVRQSLT